MSFRVLYPEILLRRDDTRREQAMEQSMDILRKLESVHNEATNKSIADISRLLQETLSRRLTAYIAGVKEGKTVSRWATGEIVEIRQTDVERRLRAAYAIASLLLAHVDPQTTKAWFIGINPQLDDESPAELIREDRFKEVFAAARAFVVGG